MIIDSHTHYSHKLYEGEFPYLDLAQGGFCLARGDRRQLLEAMKRSGISLCIEPSTSLDKLEDQLAFAAEYGPCFRLALGVHPKKCTLAPWEDREKLRRLARTETVVAIGEAGLDYAMPPEELDAACQKKWFVYQIGLAHELSLPLILHIREADRDALEILTQQKSMLHGGVAHCFGGDYETAMAYIDLGFSLGIGGRLLQDDPQSLILRETVKRVPLTSLLVETDAPYIKPDIRNISYSGKQRKKARNTSLILSAVIEKIAWLRGEDSTAVEESIYRNTLRVFCLDEGAGMT